MFSHCTVTKLSKLERDHKSVVCILDVTQKQDVSFSISGQKPNKDFCSPDADCIEYAIQGSVFRATRILCESSKNDPKIVTEYDCKEIEPTERASGTECSEVDLMRFIHVYKKRMSRGRVKQPQLTVWKIDKVRITLPYRK